MDLKTPLTDLGPVFRMKGKVLRKAGIETIEDFLFYLPFRYEDTSFISKIRSVRVGETVTLRGQVTSVASLTTKRGLSMQKVSIEDETGSIECIFFNQRYLLSAIHKGDFLAISGKVEFFGQKRSLLTREYEILRDETAESIHTGRLVPIYSERIGLSAKWTRGRIKTILDLEIKIDEYLPDETISKHNLMDLTEALYKIHFPKSLEEAAKAQLRLSFDELFLKHAASILRKKEWEEKHTAVPFKIEENRTKINSLVKNLPFELTDSQKKAVEDIFKDLAKEIPMNRLLEGDVGSGKTVVAAIAIYLAHLNGFQSAFMAPTEILANQHYETVSKLLEPLGINVELFTGSNKKAKKEAKFDVAIGTHALLHGKVNFKRLGLVVIDEQQRFGVEQRAILREKGTNPHLLTMTATPIPRTIFLTIYSDLALSYLSDMPKGRKKIKTWLVPEEKRISGYEWISKKVKTEKSQVFIVCPFIEPSETMTTVKAAKEEFERLQKDVFPKFKLGLLHGKMKPKEKDEVIAEFRNGSINILIATPVIEVGIDIPTADIMVIEASERFGLAQLHQLRGRVGRGEKESFCLLFSGSNSDQTKERLGYLQTINNGAELAEVDLRLRGPGEMFGTMQHGVPDLKIASISNIEIVKASKEAAEEIYPNLHKYSLLKQKVEETDIPKISKD